MLVVQSWRVDAGKILTRRELAAVLADLLARAPRSIHVRLNLVIFRLACCCVLRVSEIANLRLDDVRLDLNRPHLRLRRETTKGGRARRVPLRWDTGTLEELTTWKAERVAHEAASGDPFVASGRTGTAPISRHTLRRRFRTASKVLGLARLRELTIHHGRHTFISHALAGGRTLAEVRDAAGHSNVSVTSCYLHVAVDNEGGVGELFTSQ